MSKFDEDYDDFEDEDEEEEEDEGGSPGRSSLNPFNNAGESLPGGNRINVSGAGLPPRPGGATPPSSSNPPGVRPPTPSGVSPFQRQPLGGNNPPGGANKPPTGPLGGNSPFGGNNPPGGANKPPTGPLGGNNPPGGANKPPTGPLGGNSPFGGNNPPGGANKPPTGPLGGGNPPTGGNNPSGGSGGSPFSRSPLGGAPGGGGSSGGNPPGGGKPPEKKDDEKGGVNKLLGAFGSKLGGEKKDDSAGAKPGAPKPADAGGGIGDKLGGIGGKVGGLFNRGEKKDDPAGAKPAAPAGGAKPPTPGGASPIGGAKPAAPAAKADDAPGGIGAALGGIGGKLGGLLNRGEKKDDPAGAKPAAPAGGAKPPTPAGGAPAGGASPFGAKLGGGAAAATPPKAAPAKDAQPSLAERLKGMIPFGKAETKKPAAKAAAKTSRNGKPVEVKQLSIPLDKRLELVGIVMVLSALVLLLSSLSPTRGTLTHSVNSWLSETFGWGAIGVPLAMLPIGIWLIMLRAGEETPVVDVTRVVGVMVLYLCALTLMQFVHSFNYKVGPGQDYLATVRDIFLPLAAQFGQGGGRVGGTIYYLLISNFTEIGGLLMALCALVIGLMLATSLSVSQLAIILIGNYRALRDAMRRRALRQAAARAELAEKQQQAALLAAAQQAAAPKPEALPAAQPVKANALPAPATMPLPTPGTAAVVDVVKPEERSIPITMGGRTVTAPFRPGDSQDNEPIAVPAPRPAVPVEAPRAAAPPAASPVAALPAKPDLEKKDEKADGKVGGLLSGIGARLRPGGKSEAEDEKPAKPDAEKESGGGLGGRLADFRQRLGGKAEEKPVEASPSPSASTAPVSSTISRTLSTPAPASPAPSTQAAGEEKPAEAAPRPSGLSGLNPFRSSPPAPAASTEAKPADAKPEEKPAEAAPRPSGLSGVNPFRSSPPAPAASTEAKPADAKPEEKPAEAAPRPSGLSGVSPFRATPLGSTPAASTGAKPADGKPEEKPAEAAPRPSGLSGVSPFQATPLGSTPAASTGAKPADGKPGDGHSPFMRPAAAPLDDDDDFEDDLEDDTLEDEAPTPKPKFSKPAPFVRPPLSAAKPDDEIASLPPAQPKGVGPLPRQTQTAARVMQPRSDIPDLQTRMSALRGQTVPEDGNSTTSRSLPGAEERETSEMKPVASAPVGGNLPPFAPPYSKQPARPAAGAAPVTPPREAEKPAATVSPAAAVPVTPPREAEKPSPAPMTPLPEATPFAPKVDNPPAASAAPQPASQPAAEVARAPLGSVTRETATPIPHAANPAPPPPPARTAATLGGTSAVPAPSSGEAKAPPPPPPPRRGMKKDWKLPDASGLLTPGQDQELSHDQLLEKARVIEDTLSSFGAPGRVVEVRTGPVITQFGVEPDYLSRGGKKNRVKVSAIAALDKDIQLALGAKTIRIEAPVPGKGYVGIEVPNDKSTMVRLRDVLESPGFQKIKSPLAIALGQSVDGTPVAADLASMPHLLIAGTTGSGKSVCVNAVIASLLLKNGPDRLRFIMVDPKRVELTGYNGIPHLAAPVVVEIERAVGVLKWVTREMDERYRRFANAGARNIEDFNRHLPAGEDILPYIVVIIDELADLMMLASDETERLITRIAALARATGIHLVIATQRPSVDVVTGLIKANFPARVAFMVASGTDSRVILDQPGADRLLGRGDMLYMSGNSPAPERLQGVFVADAEISNITHFWRTQVGDDELFARPMISAFALDEGSKKERGGSNGGGLGRGFGAPAKQEAYWDRDEDNDDEDEDDDGIPDGDDELYDQAVDLVRRLNKASVSLLQRRLRIGYTRAARLIDVMEERGVVGPPVEGSKPRDVLPPRP